MDYEYSSFTRLTNWLWANNFARKHTDFDRNVFINCPFDDKYEPLLQAMVFTLHDLGMRPLISRSKRNSSIPRLNKIAGMLAECKYSIHDLSRTELDKENKLPRFNMPLELGLDLGCRYYGWGRMRQKVSLILDTGEHRYDEFISDISGHDIGVHDGQEILIIYCIRNWLPHALDTQEFAIPSGRTIVERYEEFKADLPKICINRNFDINDLPYIDLSRLTADWIIENPL